MKTCIKCNTTLDEIYFKPGRNVCIHCIRKQNNEYNKLHYQKHKERIKKLTLKNYYLKKDKYKEQTAEYRKNNKEKIKELNNKYKQTHLNKIKEKNRKYYQEHKELIKAKTKEYIQTNKEKRNRWYRQKRKTDINFKLKHNISNLILKHLKLKNISKNNSLKKILGYTIYDLRLHLEKQFEPWMTWENHGITANCPKVTWHIDHIQPINTFNITSIHCKDFKKCWALENLRPLDSYINVRRPKTGNDIITITIKNSSNSYT